MVLFHTENCIIETVTVDIFVAHSTFCISHANFDAAMMQIVQEELANRACYLCFSAVHMLTVHTNYSSIDRTILFF